jgi:alpha-L-fucosidase
MKYIFFTLLVFLGLHTSCSLAIDPPKPYGAIPSKSQLLWHEMEYFSLVCYGLNTYTEVEWAYGDVDPALFNPSDLDTDQWARVAREAGMKGLILVAKHHDGFCLWPSKYTNYSVKATPWKDGQGDVLGDLANSCKKYGLKLGVYLSPWDRNYADYGKPDYVQYYYKQLEELLTQYGDVFEFWIDGANGGTGYYGGADEKRNIDRETYYGYDSIFSIVKKNQPNATIFSDVGPGSRWVGNESGIGGETNWNTINTHGKFPGDPSTDYHKKLAIGEAGGKSWIPAEVNTTLLWPKAWYYHTGRQPRSLANLMDLYYTSIGRGSPLNLGLAIAPTGQIRKDDAQVLLKFREQVNREFADNLVENADISASDSRGNNGDFSPQRCVDESTITYWATSDGIQNASLYIDFEKETTFNRLLLQEYIALGQRVHEFVFEVEKNGKYQAIAQGTTIGYKRILRFDEVQASKIRITLKTKAPCLTLSNIGIYNAPLLVADPVSSMDEKGNLSFKGEKDISVFYAIGDLPRESEFKQYTKPLYLPRGGTVHSFAKDKDTGFQTEVLIEEFGIARDHWKVVDANGRRVKDGTKAIDNDPNTFYEVKKNAGKTADEIIIDMGEIMSLDGFSYLPRQDGQKDGMIYEYRVYVRHPDLSWSNPLAQGSFSNIENNPVCQRIKFENKAEGRYVKLVSKSTTRPGEVVSFAELEVYSSK